MLRLPAIDVLRKLFTISAHAQRRSCKTQSTGNQKQQYTITSQQHQKLTQIPPSKCTRKERKKEKKWTGYSTYLILSILEHSLCCVDVFLLLRKGKKWKKKTSFGLKTNGVLTFYYMMEWPPKRHTAILLCSKGLEEAIKGHSVLHTRSSKRQKYKRNINGNSNNNNNNNKTNKT